MTNCLCGFDINEIEASGGIVAGGVAVVSVSPNRYTHTGAGGSVCEGSAIISTSLFWDNYSGVFHLQESEAIYINAAGLAGGSTRTSDETPTQTASNLFSEYTQGFDGNDFITIPLESGGSSDYSVSLWFKITGRFLERTMFSRGLTDGNNGEGVSVRLYHTAGNQIKAQIQVIGSLDWKTYTLSTPLVSSGCWHHVCLTFESGVGASLYVDGESMEDVAILETTLVPSSTQNQIGRIDQYAYACGEIQELRYLPAVLSADWVSTEFITTCSQSYTIGDEENPMLG